MSVTINLGKMVTYNKGNPPMISQDHLSTWTHEVMWLIETKYLLFCMAYGFQTWQDCDLWGGETIHEVVWPYNCVVSWHHMTNQKGNISSSARCMATKLGKMITYGGLNPSIKLNNSLTTWSRAVTEDKNDISSSTRPTSTNIGRVMACGEVTYPWSRMTLWSRIHLKSRYK